MSAPVISFLPRGYYEQQGYQQQEDRRERKRADARRAMMELADQLASQGVKLTPEKMLELQQQVSGPEGWLYGFAPPSAVVESVRAASNAKAQQVETQRAFEKRKLEDEEDSRITRAVEEMARSGADQAQIAVELQQRFGERGARKATELPGIVSRINAQDLQSGIQLGMAFEDTAAAQAHIDRFKDALTQAQREGILRAARRNEQRRDQEIQNQAITLGGQVGVETPDEARSRAAEILRPYGLDNDAARVDQVTKQIIGAQRMAVASGDYKMGRLQQTTAIQDQPNQAVRDATLGHQEQVAQRAREEAARKQVESARDERRRVIADTFSKIKVDKKNEAAARQAMTFLSNHSVSPADEQAIMAAISNNPDEVTSRIAEISKRASTIPYEKLLKVDEQLYQARVGQGFTGNALEDFTRVSMIGYDPAMLKMTGEFVRQIKSSGQMSLAQQKVDEFAAKVAKGVMGLRTTLKESGRFGADKLAQAEYERDAIMRYISPFAAEAGEELMRVYVKVIEQIPPAEGIKPEQTARDMYRENTRRLNSNAGVPLPNWPRLDGPFR